MEKPRQKRLGDLLVKNRFVTEEQLSRALVEQGHTGRSLGRVLVDGGVISEGQLTAVLAEQVGIEYVDLDSYPVNPEAVGRVNREIADRCSLIPIDLSGDRLVVAMSDPTNSVVLEELKAFTGMKIIPVVSTKTAIAEAIERFMVSRIELAEPAVEDRPQLRDPSTDRMLEEIAESIDDEPDNLQAIGEEAPVVRLVNLILNEAIHDGASDIHIEPGEKQVRIRFRVDGVLHETRTAPRKIHQGIVSRLKILAGMNIAERRVPQDGRFKTSTPGKDIDVRAASLPTIYGEKMVLRLLDRESLDIGLVELGMEPEPLRHFGEAFKKPYGTVVVTGPTGSGKTTTMYSALAVLNRRSVNIITVEDPVEYQLRGINQVQVNEKVGLTFRNTLRSILRCDPDVVMIGEIRDLESASMAIESALTGHMVLCTLHTNDAASAMTRFIQMGVESFLVASAIDLVASQRLARRLCRRCKQEAVYDPRYLDRIGFPEIDPSRMVFFRPREGGCLACSATGFKGQVGLFEVLVVDDEMERLIVKRESSHDIGELARRKGMTTLKEDGFLKVMRGVTSIEEVLRVVM